MAQKTFSIKKVLKTITFLSLAVCLMPSNNIVHAGGAPSSVGGTIKGSGGSFGGGGGSFSGGGASGSF